MDNFGYIYVLTGPSGKHYVGQSRNIDKRFRYYKKLNSSCERQPKLARALKKHGPESFLFYIIDAANTQEELNKKECYWIDSYDAVNNGYNCWNNTLTKERINQLRQSHTKKSYERKKGPNYFEGKSNKSISKRGFKNPNFGKNMSPSQKEAIIKSNCKYTYVIITPTNQNIITDNLNKFCKENSLDAYQCYKALRKNVGYKNYFISRRLKDSSTS